MNAEAVERQILASDALPTPGPVAQELAVLSRRREVQIDEIVRVVASDPGICSRALRVVNAASHGVGRYVTTIGDAVRLLGMRGITRVAIEVSVLGRHRDGVPEFDYGVFWADALARAVAAQVLARVTRRAPPEDAFTCGLLSTVGRLALVTVFPSRYREMLATLGRATDDELAEAEREVFEVDVERLSAAMMARWGIVSLVAALQEPGQTAGNDGLLAICRAAAEVARLMTGSAVARADLARTMNALGDIGVGAELAAELFPEIVAGFREGGAGFEILLPTVGTLSELYANAVDEPVRRLHAVPPRRAAVATRVAGR